VKRPDVDPRRIAIVGASHGGVVTLLAAAERPYCAVIAQATGAAYGTTELGAVLLHNAAASIRAPLLFQHLESDTLVPIAGARHIYEWAVRFRPQVVWRSYPGAAGVEGHSLGASGNVEQWFPDYVAFLQKGFAAALDQSPPVPERPPVLRTDADLPFLLPDNLEAGAEIWSGRFAEARPTIDTLLVNESDTAIYAWKQAGSRGYQRIRVERHGENLVLALRPGTTVTYMPIDDGLLAEFNAGGRISRARLARSKLP
jgi:Dienelactone hydrolase family